MTFDITEGDVVQPLGVGAATVTNFSNTDFRYDFAINGIPFLSGIRDDQPFERGFAQVRKQQLDTAQVAGEQSLSNWWLRSQFTFTGGAGQELYEPAADESVRSRFRNSQGVDPWTDGEVSLLPSMETLAQIMPVAGPTDIPNCTVAGANDDDESYVVFANGTNTYRFNELDYQTVTGLTGVSTWLWPIGSRVLSCYNGGIDVIDVATHARIGSPRTCTGTPKAWWVKQRTIAAIANVLYEIPNVFSGGAFPAALYTHPDTSWVWTSAVETPDAILVAGYSGSKGAIYKFILDQNDGTLPVLTSATTVLEFPQGELPTAMISYLGSFVAIGTNKGVRVATVGSSGQLQLGALTVETSLAVQHLTANDRFIYAGVTAGLPDGSSGVARIDLSSPDQQGRYPYAWDVACGDGAPITGVTQVGTSGRVVVASGSVWVAGATDLVSTGWIDTSQVLYGTLEPKSFQLADVKGVYPGGSVALSANTDDGSTLLITYNASNLNEVSRLPSANRTKMGLRFTLSRSVTDATVGPTVTGWQMKALPAVVRQEVIQVPLLCYDNERDDRGQKRSTSAWARYEALVAAVESAATVTFQNLDTDELATCTIEELSFRQSSPPKGFDGFGGTIQLTLRKL